MRLVDWLRTLWATVVSAFVDREDHYSVSHSDFWFR